MTDADRVSEAVAELYSADPDAFTERLLTEEKVAVIPGSAFGPSGAGHVRMCYATSYERLEEALTRIGRFVAALGDGAPPA